MSVLYSTNGMKIHIGTAKAYNSTDFTAADFSSMTWTEVGGVTNMGSIGDSAELLSAKVISDNRVRKAKGIFNSGSQQIVATLDHADPGQIALREARKVRGTFAFKVTFNDAPAGGTPSVRYYTALVMESVEQFNQADNVMELQATLEIDSNIVEVDATEAGG